VFQALLVALLGSGALLLVGCSSAAPPGPLAESRPALAAASASASPPVARASAAPSSSAAGAAGLPSSAASAAPEAEASAPMPPRPATVAWVSQPVDNTDFYKLSVVPGAPLLVLGDNQTFVTSPDDMFVEALTPEGAPLWHQVGTAKWTRALAGAREHAFIATEFLGKLDFQGFQARTPHTATFVAKLDGQGVLTWGRVLESLDFTRMQAMAATPDGGAIVAVGVFGPAKKGPLALPVAGGQDAVLLKYDAAGEVAWTKAFAWPGYDEVHRLFVTSNGDLLVTGTRWKKADASSMALADGRCHGFVTRLGPGGEERWTLDLGADTMRVTVVRAALGPGALIVAGSLRFRNRFGAFELDAGAKDRDYLASVAEDGQVRWARFHDAPECIAASSPERLVLVDRDGVSVETPAGEATRVFSFEKGSITRITDCQLDASGSLYVAGAIQPGAKIGGLPQPGPRIQRARTSWLQPYDLGFVAKLNL
jgi:hypothetical protein